MRKESVAFVSGTDPMPESDFASMLVALAADGAAAADRRARERAEAFRATRESSTDAAEERRHKRAQRRLREAGAGGWKGGGR